MGLKFAAAQGASDLRALRAMSWEQLQAPPTGSGAEAFPSNYRFSTVIDGYVLPSAISEVFAQKKQNDVPTLTGSNKDESGASPHPDVTLEQFRKQATARYESGLGTIAEVADAQRLLTQSEIGDALARLAVWRGLLAVAAAAGDIQPFITEAGR